MQQCGYVSTPNPTGSEDAFSWQDVYGYMHARNAVAVHVQCADLWCYDNVLGERHVLSYDTVEALHVHHTIQGRQLHAGYVQVGNARMHSGSPSLTAPSLTQGLTHVWSQLRCMKTTGGTKDPGQRRCSLWSVCGSYAATTDVGQQRISFSKNNQK